MVSDTTLRWYQDLVAETRQRVGDLAALRSDPEQLHGRAELAEEGIEAVVAPGGAPISLVLSHRALRLGPEKLAARILNAQRQARDDANQRLGEVTDRLGLNGAALSGLVDPTRPPAGADQASAHAARRVRPVSGGLRIDLNALESCSAFQDDQGDRLAAIAAIVQSATASGNVFGLIGEHTGLADTYRAWQEDEVTQLGEVAAMTGDLAAGLRQTADTYRQADQDTDTHIRDLHRQVETVKPPTLGSAGPR